MSSRPASRPLAQFGLMVALLSGGAIGCAQPLPTSSPVVELPPALTATPIPEPTSDVDTLVPGASPLCEASFSANVADDAPEPDAIVLMKRGSDWSILNLPLLKPARSASAVRTLVCIREVPVKEGSYVDGAIAYQINWEVRIVQWPSGRVLKSGGTLPGGDPPDTKIGFGDAYGVAPQDDLTMYMAWLGLMPDDRTLLAPTMLNIYFVAFSPDGRLLAMADAEGGQVSPVQTLNLWNVKDGRLAYTLDAGIYGINGIAFSPDGAVLVSANNNGSIDFWNTATGQLTRTLKREVILDSVESAAFSPDGMKLTAGYFDGKIGLWDVTNGQILREFVSTNQGFTRRVVRVAFSPDGEMLASGNFNGTIDLWDVPTGRLLRTIKEYGASDLAFTLDGKALLASQPDGGVGLWEVATGQLLRTLRSDGWSVGGLALSPDGSRFAVSDESGAVELRDLVTGDLVQYYDGLTMAVPDVSFSSDGKTLAAASISGMVKLWDVP